MLFDFDPAKDLANLATHGVPLGLASRLDWESSLGWIDERFSYGEQRMIALAPLDGILFYIAYVDRGKTRRIISLRRANRREVTHYAQAA